MTHALIPPMTNDYFSRQVAETLRINQNLQEIEHPSTKKLPIYWKLDVNLVNQYPKYPNGCEAATIVMLLNYYGIDITLEEWITNYLPQKEVYEKNGKRYGPNPAHYYAGDPTSEKRGWGCFEPVIQEGIQNLLKDLNQTEKIHINTNNKKESLNSLSNLSSPIMIWTTIDYLEVTEIYEWFHYDSKETYTYPKNSHVVLITGVDNNYYYINDPLKNEKNIKVEKEQLEKSFDSMGRQAIYLNQTLI